MDCPKCGPRSMCVCEPAKECHATLDDLENCACPEPLADICPKCSSANKAWMERSPEGRSKCECGFEGKHTEWISPKRVLDKVNQLLAEPAKESGAREWWIVRNPVSDAHTLFLEKPEWKSIELGHERIHVIEYSAFKQMKRERDDARSVAAGIEEQAQKNSAYDDFRVETLTRRVADLEMERDHDKSVRVEHCNYKVERDALRTELAQFHKDHDRVYNECRREIRDRMNERDEAHAHIKTVENRNYSVEAQLTAMREREYILKGLLDVSEGARLEARKHRDRALAAVEKLKTSAKHAIEYSEENGYEHMMLLKESLAEIERLLNEHKK